MTATVSLVDTDPDLVAGVPEDELELARRALRRPRYDIPPGRWAPELMRAHEGGFALLVVEGAIVRELLTADRRSDQLLGPGDVLQEASAVMPRGWSVTWSALLPSAVVVLDARFTLAARRWPVLGLNLQRRLLDQADRVALSLAIAQLPRVDRRVLASLWQLADRWGVVTPDGVEVPLKLTHAALGRLVGARRPTISLALHELIEAGALSPRAQGGWMLHAPASDWPSPATADVASR